jgi:DNA polymerase (family 10)
MKYAQARKYAEDIGEWLKPFCTRIEIAGSIRRGRAECGDVDLVVLPKLQESFDLFGVVNGRSNLLKVELERYVRGTNGAKWLNGTGISTGATVNFLLGLKKCELNVFCAKEENFGAVWLTYTGSKEANLWMIERAQSMGLEWRALRGVVREGSVIAGKTEEEIYGALNLPFVYPCDREVANLRRIAA